MNICVTKICHVPLYMTCLTICVLYMYCFLGHVIEFSVIFPIESPVQGQKNSNGTKTLNSEGIDLIIYNMRLLF